MRLRNERSFNLESRISQLRCKRSNHCNRYKHLCKHVCLGILSYNIYWKLRWAGVLRNEKMVLRSNEVHWRCLDYNVTYPSRKFYQRLDYNQDGRHIEMTRSCSGILDRKEKYLVHIHQYLNKIHSQVSCNKQTQCES